ncbi:MAG: hypothetical protein E5299_01327 [Burkholderia gladioli]|nr:MAG: hypothetical protein E5299_01327 [Burkholderia gladioli]
MLPRTEAAQNTQERAQSAERYAAKTKQCQAAKKTKEKEQRKQ